MCGMFVYLHFMDCLHVLLSTLRLSLRFVPANHSSLASPPVLWSLLKGLLCTKQLLAKSRTAVNRLASDWSWAHLNMRPALWRWAHYGRRGESYRTKSFREAALKCPLENPSLFFGFHAWWVLIKIILIILFFLFFFVFTKLPYPKIS